jgi:transcriptional regulator of heat shock response
MDGGMIRKDGMVLTGRRQRVLMALVDEYVESATPVGSSRIAQQYLTEVSPATIRNELMGLEIDGYAHSPHTSAGRIPTNIGYRVFVNTLLLRGNLEGRASIHAMRQAGFGEDELRSLDILDKDQRVDRMLTFLSAATGLLSVLWSVKPDISVHHRGMPQLLSQPEFQDATALIPLMRFIENETALAKLLLSAFQNNGFMIRIGMEDEDGYLSSYSMIAEIYGRERPCGALAVFGPTRMDYRRVIPAVLLASRLLDYPRVWPSGW